MHQLRGPARGAFGKVVGFKEQGFVATTGGIDSDTEPGSATTNNDNIPELRARDASEEGFTLHECAHSLFCY
jgi:hypothetical protein